MEADACFNEGMIVVMAGLPGTGKSTLARELAGRTAGRVIGKDEIRHALFSAKEVEYSSRQDDFCLQVMLEAAGYLLRKDGSGIVFLDGRTFSRAYQIDNVLQAASGLHQSWRILECVCSEAVARERLSDSAVAGDHPAANRDFELYLAVRSRYEFIDLPKTVIDTEEALESCVVRGLAALR